MLSPIFLVPKPDGFSRFILNFKNLNNYVTRHHFKMESINRARELNCFMASIDLEKAYYSIPIHNDSRKYLRFSFDGNIYQFKCLPFGLSSAPVFSLE